MGNNSEKPYSFGISAFVVLCFALIVSFNLYIGNVFYSKFDCISANIFLAGLVTVLYAFCEKRGYCEQTDGKKKTLLKILSVLFAAFMIYGFNIYKHNPPSNLNLKISYAPQSGAIERTVRIKFVKTDNKFENLTRFEGNYTFENDVLILKSPDDYAQIETKANKLYITAYGDNASGAAEIDINGKKYFYDFYRSAFEPKDLFPNITGHLLTYGVTEKLKPFDFWFMFLHVFAYFSLFFMLLYYAGIIVLNKSFGLTPKKTTAKRAVIYALPCLIAGAAAFVVYYPGILYSECDNNVWFMPFGSFNPAPFLYSSVITALRKIWDAPGVVCIFQILTVSCITGYFLGKFEEKGIKPVLLCICSLLIGCFPCCAIMSVTVIKDSLYSYAVLALAFCTIMFLIEKDLFFKSKTNCILFVSSLFFVSFLRYNGLPVGVLYLLFMFLIFRKKFLCALKPSAVFVALWLLFLLFTPKMTPYVQNQSLSLMINQIHSVFHHNGKVSAESKACSDKLFPIKDFEKGYVKYSPDVFMFADEEFFKKAAVDKILFAKTYFSYFKDNPIIMLREYLIMNSYILKYSHNPEGLIKQRIMLESSADEKYKEKFAQFMPFPEINVLINMFYVRHKLFNPFIPFVFIVFFGGILCVKNGIKYSTVFFPSLLTVFLVSLTLPEPAPRYVFCMFLCVPLLVPLLFTKFENEENNVE